MATVAPQVKFQSARATVASAGGAIELAYDVFGTSGIPLVLIMGIGAQRIFWEDAWCERLVDAGFQVVRYDHRDIGESSRLDDAGVPDPRALLAKRLLGATIAAPYTLSDMATDTAGLIRALGWGSAHVVGVSLGGMVAQHLGIEHPEVVRSLTTIMTTPGSRRFLPEPRALRALFMPAPTTPEEAGRHAEALFTTIGSQAWPVDGARLRAAGALAHTRGMSPKGFLRHFAAVLASGNRASKLGTVTAPTLVIHGTRDPMFPLSAGRTLAGLVRHGTWLPMAGMGHDLPQPLWPVLVAAIRRHAGAAEARATP